MDCSLPGSSVHVIFKARILEWVDISFSSESSQLRDRTLVSYVAYIVVDCRVDSLPAKTPKKLKISY